MPARKKMAMGSHAPRLSRGTAVFSRPPCLLKGDNMMNFHETRMGHDFFGRQLPQLIQSIQALTAALDKPARAAVLPVEADPEFLSELYYGNYEPGLFKQTAEMSEVNQAVNEAYHALEKVLTEQGRETLETYLDAAAARNTADMKRAYESGFRTAVQMVMAGLSRPADEAA